LVLQLLFSSSVAVFSATDTVFSAAVTVMCKLALYRISIFF